VTAIYIQQFCFLQEPTKTHHMTTDSVCYSVTLRNQLAKL